MIINGKEFPDMNEKEMEAVSEVMLLATKIMSLTALIAGDCAGLALAAMRLALFMTEEIEKRKDYEDYRMAANELALNEFREDQKRK